MSRRRVWRGTWLVLALLTACDDEGNGSGARDMGAPDAAPDAGVRDAEPDTGVRDAAPDAGPDMGADDDGGSDALPDVVPPPPPLDALPGPTGPLAAPHAPGWTLETAPVPPTPEPGATLVHPWPDVQRTVEPDPDVPGRLRIHVRVRNNVGRGLERLRVVQTANAPVEDAVPAEGWTATVHDDEDGPPGCTFELDAGRSLADGDEARHVCVVRAAPGTLWEVATELHPPPFIGDADYDGISDFLERRLEESDPDAPLEVVIHFAGPVDDADEALLADHGGADVVATLLAGVLRARLPAGRVEAYRAAAGDRLVLIEPVPRFELFLNIVTANVRADRAWAGDPSFTGDPRTAIAVVDTGVDGTHPDVGGGKIAAWYDATPPMPRAGDPPRSAVPIDPGGHGTHVASIAAGTGAASRAMMPPGADRRGVAPTAGIVGVRTPMLMDPIDDALGWLQSNAQANGVVVANLSWGSAAADLYTEAVVRSLLTAGVLPVVAAGNGFADTGLSGAPAFSEYVLAVGAVDDGDQLAWYSSNGLGPPGQPGAISVLTKPDVVAPGGAIMINNATFVWAGQVDAAGSNQVGPAMNGYVRMSGTSMAAPVVAGEAALLVDAMTDYDARDDDGDAVADEEVWNGVDDDGDGLIDEDTGPWPYTEADVLRLKSIILMATYELASGQTVPARFLWYDRNGDGTRNARRSTEDIDRDGVLDPGEDWDGDGALDHPHFVLQRLGDEIILNPNGNLLFDAGDMVLASYAKLPVPLAWTMVADAGVAALWTARRMAQRPPVPPGMRLRGQLEYYFRGAGRRNDPRFDRGRPMQALRNPTGQRAADGFDRGGKDPREGYGRIQVDAALDAVVREMCGEDGGDFGGAPGDPKVWVRHLHLYTGREYALVLDGPDMGADFDLYLYRGTPDAHGEPVIATAAGDDGGLLRAIRPGTADERLSFEVPEDGLYYVVVRRVTGAGPFTVHLVTPQPWTVIVYMAAESDGRGGDLDDAAFAALNDMEATGAGLEDTRDVALVAQIDYAGRAWDDDPMHAGHAVRLCVRKDHRDDRSQYSLAPRGEDLGEVNMGDPATFRDLVDWTVDHFPAEHYAVVFWGNGHGWKIDPMAAIGPGGDTSGGADALELTEIEAALAAAGAAIARGSRLKAEEPGEAFIDVVGWDADLMQMIEIAEQIRAPGAGDDVAAVGVMVGPQSRQHPDGWPYAPLLEALAANARAWDGEDLGRAAVGAYHDYFTNEQPWPRHALSAVRLTPPPGDEAPARFADLLDDLDLFADELRAGVDDVRLHDDPTDNVQVIIKHRGQEATEAFEDEGFLDLRHFATNIRQSGIPAAYRAHAPPVERHLRNGGEVVLAEAHGPAHPEASGLSIYFPHDQLLPETWDEPFLPADPDDPFEPTFDNPVPSPWIYAPDAAIRLPTLGGGNPHPWEAVDGLRFRDRRWDEFLHRYYKPAADACVRLGDGPCLEAIVVLVGATVGLSAAGSSDSDGPDMDDVPVDYYWDHDPTRDVPANLPAYPGPGAGPVIDTPCTEDCDRDGADAADDDPDARGARVRWTCPAPGTFEHVAHVWDEHNLQNAVHGEQAHGIHWKLHRRSTVVHCVDTFIPWKRPDRRVTTPRDTVRWEVGVLFGERAPGFVAAEDRLPPELALVAGTLECVPGGCEPAEDEDGGTIIRWFVEGAPPGAEAIMTYETTVRIPEERIPDLPVEVVNRHRVTDPVTEEVHETAVPIRVDPPSE